MLKEQITASLEQAFSQYGFAEPSVSTLKDACNVSLRTLYKYFPSKELMIIAALEYRHQRYITQLTEDLPPHGTQNIATIFTRLAHWMHSNTNNGCMSLHALAAFPENHAIRATVTAHKLAVSELLEQYCPRPNLANELFVLHEGVANSWPTLGEQALVSAQAIIKQLLEKDNALH